jgi:putative replication protein
MKNMIGTGSALERLKKIIPASVQPKFTSVEEWQAWQETEGRRPGNRQAEPAHPVRKDFRPRRHPGAAPQLLLRKLRGVRAGTAPGIQHGKSYAQNFGGGSFASFVFSGSPGTGKNHLAAAMGNHLLAAGHSVLVVTIPDLMLPSS